MKLAGLGLIPFYKQLLYSCSLTMGACTGGFDILVHINSRAGESIFSRIIFSKRKTSLSWQKKKKLSSPHPIKKIKMVTTLFEVSLP